VINEFLDELKNSNAALWSSSADKSAEEGRARDLFQSHLAICRGGKYTNPAAACPQSRPPAM
jgi:hypothetical protein